MKLFVAQIVMVTENLWFLSSAGATVRTEKNYGITCQLFAADAENQAYETVAEWLGSDSFSDSNHDGPGDLTKIYALGINQIEEVGTFSSLAATAKERYGADVAEFWLSDVDEQGIPLIRTREQLEIFRTIT
ncbi:hypothetical protein BH10CYA1_BH10CYA1_34550 [soil metagenome]